MNRSSGNLPGLRGWLARHPVGSKIVVLLLAASAGVSLLLSLKGPARSPMDIYYYDTFSHEVFVRPINLITPIVAPSQADEADPGKFLGVRAHVFSCGACDAAATHFVGWIEKHNPERVERLRKVKDHEGKPLNDFVILERLSEMPDGTLVSDPSGVDRWFPRASRNASAIMRSVQAKCDSGFAVECQP